MKKLILTLIALAAAGWMTSASAQSGTNAPPDDSNGPPVPVPGMNGPEGGGPPDAGGPPPDFNNQPPPDANVAPVNNGNSGGNNAPILPTKPFTADQAPMSSSFMPPAGQGTNSNALIMNFRNAPLEMVLNYLSDAAGFTIILDTPVRGNVSVISLHPMTQDGAVDLLNSVLNQNGYAAIRDGQTLTIVDKNDAKTRDIPVKVSNNPEEVPKNDEIVTQVIPIRFVDAGDLVKDLSSFVSPQATVVANDAGNSIVITDTQSNIRHIMEIIRAIDNSAEAETEIRVFRLQYASPTDVANELSSVFPGSNGGTSNNQAPIRFGGPGGFFGRMFGGGGGRGGGGGGGSTDSSASDRIKKATQVTAVADSRIQAVIVTAPKDLIEEIAEMMKSLDVPSTRDQQVYVFHLKHGDPYQVSQVLQNQFQSASSSRGGSSGSGSGSSQSTLELRAQNTATSTSASGNTVGSSITGAGGGGGRGGGGGGGGF